MVAGFSLFFFVPDSYRDYSLIGFAKAKADVVGFFWNTDLRNLRNLLLAFISAIRDFFLIYGLGFGDGFEFFYTLEEEISFL